MKLFTTTLAFALAAAVTAGAQETSLIQKLQTAREMYEIGMETEDGLLVLAAAKLRKVVPVQPGGIVPKGRAPAKGWPLAWDKMLAQGAALIEGDPVLEGLAEDIRAERFKGVTGGPVYSILEIRGGGEDIYPQVSFAGGEYAEIYVEGPSGSDLNLLVRDAKGRLVCSDTDISAIAYCGWRPAADGAFDITVVNESGRGGQYSMITN